MKKTNVNVATWSNPITPAERIQSLYPEQGDTQTTSGNIASGKTYAPRTRFSCQQHFFRKFFRVSTTCQANATTNQQLGLSDSSNDITEKRKKFSL